MSTKTVPTVYQSSKIVKNSQKTVKTAKITLVYQSSQVYQDCTKQVYQQCTNCQKQSNSKNDHWCTNRHMSTQSLPNTQSPRLPSASAEYTKPLFCDDCTWLLRCCICLCDSETVHRNVIKYSAWREPRVIEPIMEDTYFEVDLYSLPPYINQLIN